MKSLFKLLLISLLIIQKITYAFEYFLPLKLINLYNTTVTVYFAGGFVCKSYNNCTSVKPARVRLYDFEKVKECFLEKYNIDNIFDCIKNGVMPPYFSMKPKSKKIIVLDFDLKKNIKTAMYGLLFVKGKDINHIYYEWYKISDISKFKMKYYNAVFLYLYWKGSFNDVLSLLKPIDIGNGTVIKIKNVYINNFLFKSLPIYVYVPVKISIAFCNMFKFVKKIYFPEDIKKLVKIPIIITVQIFHNKKIVFRRRETVYQNVGCTKYKILSIIWIPKESGEYLVRVTADISSRFVRNSKPVIIERKIKVYSLFPGL